MYVTFETPTALDIRAITTFGLNAKPNSRSPIGYFGTGLKMAIATLVRNDIPVNLTINKKHYRFTSFEQDFRGKSFQQVKMHRNDGLLTAWQQEDLPFTTELAKNWQLWMAFRELYSNTIDEQGEIRESHNEPEVGAQYTQDRTIFTIGPSREFHALYNDKGTIILPLGLREHDHNSGAIQIFHAPSDYIYYRSIRVMKLSKPSIMTYNILEQQQLTEDRTLADQWYVPYQIARALLTSTDKAFINHLLNATDKHYEYELPFDSVSSAAPSKEFQQCLNAKKAQPPHPRHSTAQLPSYRPIYASPRIATMQEQHKPKEPVPKLHPKLYEFIERQRSTFSADDLILLQNIYAKLVNIEGPEPKEPNHDTEITF